MKKAQLGRSLTRLLVCLLLASLLCVSPLSAQDTEDSRTFLAGFNAFQQKSYSTAIARFDEVLQKYPDTPLRDMTLFWLARSHFQAGNRQEAGRYMAQFNREYPDNPLRNTVDEELLALATQQQKAAPAANRQQQVAAADSRKQAEAERLAAQKAEKERLAQQQAEQAAAEKARIIKAKAEAERIAREKLEAERAAQAKLEQERLAREQEAARRKAEEARQAAAQAEAERLAQQKAAQQAAEKAAQAAAAQREQELAASQKAELEAAEKARLLKAKAEQERLAREAAAAAKLAAAKAEQERLAKAQAEEATRLAAQKADEERKAAEKAAQEAAARKEQELAAARKAEAERQAAEQARLERARMKERAIAEYKGIIERFPSSPAARTAAARLKDLGIAIALPAAAAETGHAEPGGTSQTLTLEVAQYAAFEFTPLLPAQAVAVAQKTTIPFVLQNRGNGPDRFVLSSGFPTEFGARFAAAAAPEQPISETPELAPGESFQGLLQLTVPPATLDGLRISYPVRAASRFMAEASQSRVVSLSAAAPLLRAVVKTDKTQLLPGDKAEYTVTVLNVGSIPAREVTLRLNFPAQYHPSGEAPGFRQELHTALVLDNLSLKPGERKTMSATFQLKEGALAQEELIVRADLENRPLETRSSFLSNVVHVLPVRELALAINQERVTAVPGQLISIPARVTNKGNRHERISLVATADANQKVTIYHDLNRDGLRQPGEPEVTELGPLGPKEEASLVLELTAPKHARDGAVEKLTLTAAPENSQGIMARAEARIAYSRPVLQLAMKGREGRLVPGELLTVELAIQNHGSNLARQVQLEVTWPEQVELVTSDLATATHTAGTAAWRFNELGANERRIVKASFRIKSGTGVGTGLQVKSLLTYQDQAGNRY